MGHNHSKGSSGHSSQSKAVCPSVNESGPAIQPIVGDMTFHKVAMIVSGATAIFSCLLALVLIFRHATHFSNPPEQKQIIRIINIIPVFAVVSFLTVWQDKHALYIVPALDVGEAFPMAAFFLLLSTYMVPHQNDRGAFPNPPEAGRFKGYTPQKFFKLRSLFVLQWIPVSIILWAITCITLATNIYCATSNGPRFAHLWITLFRMVSTTLAIVAILRFYGQSKHILKPRGAFKQLLCFKIIVFLNFIQTFIFNWLMSSGKLHASNHLTFNDLAYSIPSLILSCEIAIIAVLFFYAYSPNQYIIGRGRSGPIAGPIPHEYYGGPLGIYAFLSAINIFDIIHSLLQGARAGAAGDFQPGDVNGEGEYESTPAGETLKSRV